MLQRYDQFVERVTHNHNLLLGWCNQVCFDFKSLMLTLPTSFYRSLWSPIIQSQGFYPALHKIPKVFSNFLKTQLKTATDEEREQIQIKIQNLLLYQVIKYQTGNISVQEIGNRIKQLRKIWNITLNHCGVLVTGFQLSQDKENQQQSKRQKIISDMMIIFDTNQGKIDYTHYGIAMLTISVGEAVYYLSDYFADYEEIYRRFILIKREKIYYLLSKIRKRQTTLAAIYSHIVHEANNRTAVDKIKNICILFLLTQSCQSFRDQTSKLKQTYNLQIIAEAFHRMFYYSYERQSNITELMINFMKACKFPLFQQLKRALSYHLLALHKLKVIERDDVTKLIEKVWKQKFGDAKINEMYIEKGPSFIYNSQKTMERTLQECETKSIGSSSSRSSLQFKSLNGTSKSKKSNLSLKLKTLHTWIDTLLSEMKMNKLQKVYLLIEGFKSFYSNQYIEQQFDYPPKKIVIEVILNLIKKIESKQRKGLKILCSAIYLDMSEMIDQCYIKQSSFQQSLQNLGTFQLCLIDNGYLNLQSFIKFHQKNNSQESLQTVLTLKLLKNQLNRSAAAVKVQSIDELLINDSFNLKVYQLFKLDYADRRIDCKKLMIIGRLIMLKSNCILYNLLVNYVYMILKQEKINDPSGKKRFNLYSQLMNKQIMVDSREDRIRLFLQMGQILDGFDKQSSKRSINTLLTFHTSNKYFELLRRKEHSHLFHKYSLIYYRLNYLKEAAFFLELHHSHCDKQQQNGAVNKQLALQAIQIYRRLSPSFQSTLPHIVNRLNIVVDKNIKQQGIHYNLSVILMKLNWLIEQQKSANNVYKQRIVNGQPIFQIWMKVYKPILAFFIQQMHTLSDSEQLNEAMLKYSITIKYINAKIQQIDTHSSNSFASMPIIVQQIQQLRNVNDQIVFCRHLLQEIQSEGVFELLQKCYLDKLLKSCNYDDMYSYLRSFMHKTESNAKMNTSHLTYLVKYHFKRQEYNMVLGMLSVLKKEDVANIGEINQIELECCFHGMLNYTLEDSLNFINSKCLIEGSKSKEHLVFYLKIFRMLFNRYNFIKVEQNDLFLATYFNFIDKNLIITHFPTFIPQTIFHLIRFVIQKFYYGTELKKDYGRQILSKFNACSEHFVPFLNYLIKSIRTSSQINKIITTMVRSVIVKHPQTCIWIISFLKNFAFYIPKGKLAINEEKQIMLLNEIYKQVSTELQASNLLNRSHLFWIDNLTKLAHLESNKKQQGIKQFKQLELPAQLPFLFDSDYFICKLTEVKVLNNGKSAPLQVTLSLSHQKQKKYKQVRVIIKGNLGCKKYRLQSNTANFFQQTALIDQDITYRILHLTKYMVIIEHVINIGTLNSIIMNHFPEIKKTEEFVYIECQKRKQSSVQKNQRRLLGIYDEYKSKLKTPLSKIILQGSKNVKDWWTRIGNFIRTHAQWSYLGYIVGLGDRHPDNILMTGDGKLIHIDFQYVLDTGLKLPFPQWVPFRLTNCLIEPLGVLGVYGRYFSEMVVAAEQFQQKQASIWKALSHFVGSMDTNVAQQILERSKFKNLRTANREEGIARVIHCASDPQLLRLMFQGWRAYL